MLNTQEASDSTCGCTDSSSGNPTAFGDRFWYRTVDDTAYNFGRIQNVVQNPVNPVRCMPGGYDLSRTTPLPFIDRQGLLLLYSASDDVQCNSTIFGGAFVTMTALTASSGVVAPSFYTITPCRILDTRQIGPPPGQPLTDTSPSMNVTIGGSCGIPTTAKAVALNATVASATAQVSVEVYPGDLAVPTGTITVAAGPFRPTVAGSAVTGLASTGKGTVNVMAIFGGSGSAHFLIDVAGYFE